MKLFLALTTIVISLISQVGHAVECGPALVRHIQISDDKALVYLEGQSWHRVGSFNDKGTEFMVNAIIAAQTTGTKITLRYPDGYDCEAYELEIPASMVRTHSS